MRFADEVYRLTQQVPKGKVTTYGEIARAMGTKAYRAVGQALHVNPYAPHVPCHRVVASDGSLHGFAHGLKKKAEMLQQEGIEVSRGKIDLSQCLFTFRAKK